MLEHAGPATIAELLEPPGNLAEGYEWLSVALGRLGALELCSRIFSPGAV